MKHQERLRGYFESHPNTDKFFVTQDGSAFFTRENAEAYAQVYKTPEEKVVEEVTRAEVMGAKKAAPEMINHTVTQEYLDTNPELTEQGVKSGDAIEIPTPAKKVAAKKAPSKKTTAKK